MHDNLTLRSSEGYNNASGNFYLAASNGTTDKDEIFILETGVNTKKFEKLTISWGEYRDKNFPGSLGFAWSSNGKDWEKLEYNDVNTFSTWVKIKEVVLPMRVENLFLKWSYRSNNNLSYFAIDDIVIRVKNKDSRNKS